jgi:hypothetical protein
VYPDTKICAIYQDLKIEGIPHLTLTALAYCNSRFCILKFTKPDDERDLQVPASPADASNAA